MACAGVRAVSSGQWRLGRSARWHWALERWPGRGSRRERALAGGWRAARGSASFGQRPTQRGPAANGGAQTASGRSAGARRARPRARREKTGQGLGRVRGRRGHASPPVGQAEPACAQRQPAMATRQPWADALGQQKTGLSATGFGWGWQGPNSKILNWT
jgi:hypothetical protein